MLTLGQRETVTATQSGLIHPFMLRTGEICKEDMALALSNICRYGGHVRPFYSVAQHSNLVSTAIRQQGGSIYLQFAAHIHDGGEVYPPGDLLASVAAWFPSVRRMKYRTQQAVYVYFLGQDITAQDALAIKQADKSVMALEARHLFKDWQKWPSLRGVLPPYNWEMWRGPIPPAAAEIEWLERLDELVTGWEGERYAHSGG